MCFCPACDCETHNLLGVLGSVAHLRCQNCGIDHSVPVSDLPMEDETDTDQDETNTDEGAE